MATSMRCNMAMVRSLSSVRRRWLAFALGAGVLAVALSPRAAGAQGSESEFRASDGTTYQVLRANNLGGVAAQLDITTVAGTIAGAGSCAATGNMSGDEASAVGGVISPNPLHSYDGVTRSFVLTPNDIGGLTFDPSFSGRVTLGSGPGALEVCASAADCPGGSEPVVDLASNLGGVPPACI